MLQMTKNHKIILASASPRRQQFFREMGLDFEIRIKSVEEVYPTQLEGSAISDYLAEMNYLDASIRGIRKKIRTTSIARPCAARHSLSPFLGHGHILISYFHHQTCLRYSQNTHWTKSSRPKVLS